MKRNEGRKILCLHTIDKIYQSCNGPEKDFFIYKK